MRKAFDVQVILALIAGFCGTMATATASLAVLSATPAAVDGSSLVVPIGVMLAGVSVITTVAWRLANEKGKIMSMLTRLEMTVASLESAAEQQATRMNGADSDRRANVEDLNERIDDIGQRLTVIETRCDTRHQADG